MSDDKKPNVARLVMIAAVVTLAVTLIRYFGELQEWNPALFNTKAGGGMSAFGIAWLVPVFGFLFGRALIKRGSAPKSRGKAVVLCIAGFAAAFGIVSLIIANMEYSQTRLWLITGVAVACGFAAYFAWPGAWLVNAAYGFMARVPVAIVQYVSITKNQNTHYSKVPEGVAADDALLVLTVAQLSFWPLCYTVLVGGLFAALGSMTARKH